MDCDSSEPNDRVENIFHMHQSTFLWLYIITRGTIYILNLGNTKCSQVPSDIFTGKFGIFDHNHL